MPYDAALADRVRSRAGARPGLPERRMCGGPAFPVHGRLAVGAAAGGGLLVPVPPGQGPGLPAPPHVRPSTMRGRARARRRAVDLRAVDSRAVADDDALGRRVDRGLAAVRTLTPAG